MKWLSHCINRLYSSSCTNELATTATASILPPMDIKELSPVVAINCKGCIEPCAQHPLVPTHLNIDQSKPLHNTVPPYAIHIIIMTGKTDWPAHREGLAQALIEAIQKRKHLDHRPFENRYHPAYSGNTTEDQAENQRVIVTNSSLPSSYSTLSSAKDIILLPDSIIISNVTIKRVDALLDYIFGKPCFQTFSTYPCPFSSLILVCGHGNKDRRCGTVGPMLQNALQQASMQATKEEGTTQVALVSHLGGHAFAGNLVVYTHNGHRAIWYGRVTPCYCKDIIENTLDDDKVIEDLVRGIFEVKLKPSLTCQANLEW
ncbi:Sucrase/ferredoxin-like-domain-containing protein [Thamnidium elegans]|nr:Sucrase/ferredoxin-like-domain-containing protein [Thamnidium elegans]